MEQKTNSKKEDKRKETAHLIHSSVGEKQGGILIGHNLGRRDESVLFALEKVHKDLSDAGAVPLDGFGAHV